MKKFIKIMFLTLVIFTLVACGNTDKKVRRYFLLKNN